MTPITGTTDAAVCAPIYDLRPAAGRTRDADRAFAGDVSARFRPR